MKTKFYPFQNPFSTHTNCMRLVQLKIILLLVFVGLFNALRAQEQYANPDIQAIIRPAFIQAGSTATLELKTCNTGSGNTDQIVANSLQITITVGTNAEIIGIDQANTDNRWTQFSLTTGAANTMLIRNTGGTMTSIGAESDCAVINVLVKALSKPSDDQYPISASISYIAGTNPLIWGLPNAAQGNVITMDDNASTGLSVFLLPAHLLSFTAVKDKQTSVLHWQYDYPTNLAYIELEKSADSIHYKSLSNKKYTAPVAQAIWDTGTLSETDVWPVAGNNYYRLKMEDKNGVVGYSAIRKLNFADDFINAHIMAFPVPAKNSITVKGANAAMKITVYDITGKLLQTMQASGTGTDNIIIDNYAAGNYVLLVTDGATTKIIKIMKQE